MKRILNIVLPVMFAVSLSCVDPGSPASLMDQMPAGHHIYFTVDPVSADLDNLLNLLGSYISAGNGWHASAQEVFGFDPTVWPEWVEALAIRPQGEIGIIFDASFGEFDAITLYIPSDDPGSVETFFQGIRERTDLFDSSMRFLQTENYTVVMLSRNPDFVPIDSTYILDSSILDSDEYSELRRNSDPGLNTISLFAYSDIFPDTEGLSAALLTIRSEDRVAAITFRLSIDEPSEVPFIQTLSHRRNGGDITVPEGTTAAARISFDMEDVGEFLYSNGIDREFEMGLEEFGFASFQELLDCFSGDLYAGLTLSRDTEGGFIQIGIGNMDGASLLLESIIIAVAGNRDPGLTTFQLDGMTCCRTTSTGSINLNFMEFGIVDSAIVISGNVSLENVRDGQSFSAYSRDKACGLDCQSGFILTADLQAIVRSEPVSEEFRGNVTSTGVEEIALSSGYRDGIFSISAGFRFSQGNGLEKMVDFILSNPPF